MNRSLHSSISTTRNSSPIICPTRRNFLLGATTAFFTANRTNLFATAFAPDRTDNPLKIEAVELIELHGRYTDPAGINRQQQVNPLDIYDELRPSPYADKPSGTHEVLTTAIYLRIRTSITSKATRSSPRKPAPPYPPAPDSTSSSIPQRSNHKRSSKQIERTSTCPLYP